MLVHRNSRDASRHLAASIVATARGPLQADGDPADARVLDAGGGWHVQFWREELRQLASRNTVVALTVRTLPNEPRLPDADWAALTRALVDRLGLTDQPWALVRTRPATVVLITDASKRSVRRDLALEFVEEATERLQRGEHVVPPVDDTAGAEPRDVADASFAEPAEPAEVAVAAGPVTVSSPATWPAASRPRTR